MNFDKLFLDTMYALSSVDGDKTVIVNLTFEQHTQLNNWFNKKPTTTTSYIDITNNEKSTNSVYIYGIKFIFNETN